MAGSGVDGEHRFGSGEPFSIGVEEELFLVDPVTGTEANTSGAVLERLGEVDGQVERELHACQVELITGVHSSAEDAVRELVEEGLLRAARFGVHGRLPDAGGTLRSVSDLLDDALGRAQPWADGLGCADALAGLRELMSRGGGAGVQRGVYEIPGIDAVARRLVELTQPGD